MLAAGKLRYRITIQKNTPTTSATGASVDSWSDVLRDYPASIEPLSGREYFLAQQVQPEQITRFRIRYPRIQIWPGMRIKLYDFVLDTYRYFNINSAIDLNERHVEMFLMATEQIVKVS